MEPPERKLEYKEKETHTRAYIAAKLRDIAAGVELGGFNVGDMHLDMPDTARLELDVETNKLEIEIEWGPPRRV